MKLRSWGPVVALAAIAFSFVPTAAQATAVAVPPGYRVVREEALHRGVHHVELVKDDGPQRVHVAVVDPKQGVRIQPVLSSGQVSGPAPRLERTSSMCARVECIAAVNADFAHPDTEESVGAFAARGELKRSPVNTHHQLFFDKDGRGFAGLVTSTIKVVSTDLKELATPNLNVARADEGLVLYTPAFGKSTGTNAHGAELVGRVTKPKGPLRIGQTAVVHLTQLRDGAGDTPIPRNGIVLSGHGAAAEQLRALWRNVEDGTVGKQVLLRVETTPSLTDTVGGVPVLVRNGQRFVGDEDTPFFRGRHPRTMVGWTAAGTLLLVTADGRQPGYAAGLSLPEAADLMVALGALEAINLDGGGSTTFVSKGEVANRPSDQLVERKGLQQIVSLAGTGDRIVGAIERPTVSALAIVIVPTDESSSEAEPALDTFDLALPVTTVDLPPPTAADPASHPSGALPAVVRPVASDAADHTVLAFIAALLTATVGAATARAWRAQRAHSC